MCVVRRLCTLVCLPLLPWQPHLTVTVQLQLSVVHGASHKHVATIHIQLGVWLCPLCPQSSWRDRSSPICCHQFVPYAIWVWCVSFNIILNVFITLIHYRIQSLLARLQMSTWAGPIISVISVRTTVSCHNSSSSASSNPRRSWLPAYQDCHIWFTCLRSFWSHMLECTTAIPKVTVVETRTVL